MLEDSQGSGALQKRIKIPDYLSLGKIVLYVLYAWIIFGVFTLMFRVFFLATSANSSTSFVSFIYRTSADFLRPFQGIFPGRPLGETGYIDVAAMFAIFMYLLLAWLINSMIVYVQAKINKAVAEQKIALHKAEEERLKHSKNRSGEVLQSTTYVTTRKKIS